MKKILGILVLFVAAGLVACGSSSSDSTTTTTVAGSTTTTVAGTTTTTTVAGIPASVVFTIDDSIIQNVTDVNLQGSTFTATPYESIPMFDDGTHGDVTASDHIWSVTVSVVASGEWGAVGSKSGAASGWLLAAGVSNLIYTYDPAGTVTGVTSYAILPAPKADVTLTVNDTADNGLAALLPVAVKGNFSGWATVNMTNDGTGLWTYTALQSETSEWGFVYGTAGTWGVGLADAFTTTASDNNPMYTVTASGVTGNTTLVISTGAVY